ncbi:hypothetical protein TWF694_001824 [Orbilia ellipsospora]|uniref:NAD(P)-binding protein n=1 Tax=Orbilia ellipsospora TaxID=2528407 RepID=A0AAV9X553_9PEZI
MVSYKQVLASNALINDATVPSVAVFVGGTSGIGNLTIKALVATGASVRIYLVGRSSAKERTLAFIEAQRNINAKAEIIWIEGDVSLLAESKRVCELIKSKEPRIDLLFMSTGYTPFGPRNETAEGHEVTLILAYYTRILFILKLLPNLNAAEAPRIVTVLAGGHESVNVDLDDMELKKEGNFGPMKVFNQNLPMTTMTMEKIAEDNAHITLIHSAPGWVDTGNVRKGMPPPNTILAWLIWLILEPLIHMFSFSDQESGQRYLFQATSAAFGGRGVSWNGKVGANSWGKTEDGLFIVGSKCDTISNGKVYSVLREKAKEKIWDYTMEVLKPYL